jgi:hypothetical protein
VSSSDEEESEKPEKSERARERGEGGVIIIFKKISSSELSARSKESKLEIESVESSSSLTSWYLALATTRAAWSISFSICARLD